MIIINNLDIMIYLTTAKISVVSVNTLFHFVQGLNVIKTVVDLKGTKRFKKPKQEDSQASDMELTAGPNSNARAHFRKITTQTSYCKTFGERPKAQEDFGILKNKKFSDLEVTKILKPHVV